MEQAPGLVHVRIMDGPHEGAEFGTTATRIEAIATEGGWHRTVAYQVDKAKGEAWEIKPRTSKPTPWWGLRRLFRRRVHPLER